MNARHRTARAAAGALLLALAGTAQAGPNELFCWTWDAPVYPAEAPQFIQQIQVWMIKYVGDPGVATARTGAEAADNACAQIEALHLTEDRPVWILFFGFAKGNRPGAGDHAVSVPLLYHPDDALADDPSYGGSQVTPWMNWGIYDTGNWIDDFIQEYEINRAASTTWVIPKPTRFHFDSEWGLFEGDTDNLTRFGAMMSDVRWDNHYYELPGYPGKTLADVYSDGGSPDFYPAESIYHPDNHDWTVWYAGVSNQVVEGAFDAAAYSKLYHGWCPHPLSSNYDTSIYVGGGDAYPECGAAGADWAKYVWTGAGKAQAPMLYTVDSAHGTGGETQDQYTLRAHRERLDICRHGNGGVPITPWILLPHNPPNGGCDDGYDDSFTEAFTRQDLALLRAKGVTETIVFGHDNEHDPWTEFVRALDWSWGADLMSYTVTTGTETSVFADPLSSSMDDPLVVTSAGGNSQLVVVDTVYTSIFNDITATTDLDVNFEGYASTSGVTATVYLKNSSSGLWEPIKTDGDVAAAFSVSATSATPTIKTVNDHDADTNYHLWAGGASNGYIGVRVVFSKSGSTPFTAYLDLVQVIKTGE